MLCRSIFFTNHHYCNKYHFVSNMTLRTLFLYSFAGNGVFNLKIFFVWEGLLLFRENIFNGLPFLYSKFIL